ncbi:mitochondrial carrier protein [Haematococcus lacustris]
MSCSDTERRKVISMPLRLAAMNPLGWVPRPRLCRSRKQSSFASTSVAVADTLLSSSSSSSGGSNGSSSSGGSSGVVSLPATNSNSLSSLAASPPAKVPLKPASDVLCGALARAASQSTIHPLDTLKVRIQARTKGASPPPGMSKIGRLVPPTATPLRALDLKEMGKTVASLYRGVFGAASGAGIAIGTYFAFYGAACNVLSARTDMPASGIAFVSGGIAAVGSSVVKVPLAVCIRSVQAGVYPNVFAAARSITTAVGVRGLFTGFLPTLLEDVPDMAIKFAAYESMRQVQSRIRNGRPASPQEDFAMGAVAGSLAAAATTPLDVIKTNMMCTAASRPSMLGAVRMVYEQGGSAAFFRGIGPRALSNGINSAVFFAFFEALRSCLATHKQRAAATAAAQLGSGSGACSRSLSLESQAVPLLTTLLPPAPPAAGHGSRAHLQSLQAKEQGEGEGQKRSTGVHQLQLALASATSGGR